MKGDFLVMEKNKINFFKGEKREHFLHLLRYLANICCCRYLPLGTNDSSKIIAVKSKIIPMVKATDQLLPEMLQEASNLEYQQ